MASLPIRPLDGVDGYLRRKESVLLRLHSVDVAHVLSDDPPAPASGEALSDRLLPDYVRHATGRARWEAVARTYDLDTAPVYYERFLNFQFEEGGPFLEQLAYAEAPRPPMPEWLA